jgi:putative transposase
MTLGLTEVVMLVIYHYCRFKVSLDDVVELMALRGFSLSHQTVHNWVQTCGVTLGRKCRSKRKGQAGKKWYVDATYLKVEGRWCYFYRAIDKEGDLVDVYLSDVCDQAAAEACFRQAQETTGGTPEQITADKERALYPAIKNILKDNTKHRDSNYMNNAIEQNHRGIKLGYKPMKGFKNVFSALIFCTAFEEIKLLFRMKNKTRSQRRQMLAPKFKEMQKLFMESA